MIRNVASLVLVGVIAVVLGAGDLPAAATPQRTGIVGGQLVPDNRFPWMVRLSMGCGGALTAPRVVLTAGHCVTGSGPNTGILATAGVTDLHSAGAITARSVKVIRDPGFLAETRGDDWAVIQLDHPLALPTLSLSPGGDAGPFTILGWGQTSEAARRQETRLRYATVPLVSDATCASDYARVNVRLVADEMICAAGRASTAARATRVARWSAAPVATSGCRSASSAGDWAAPGPAIPASTARSPPSARGSGRPPGS